MFSTGVTEQDVREASERTSGYGITGWGIFQSDIPSASYASAGPCFVPESADGRDLQNIGSRFNQWRKPVTEYGSNNPQWEVKLKASPYIDMVKWLRGKKNQ